MIRRPPRSTRTATLVPTRRPSDLGRPTLAVDLGRCLGLGDRTSALRRRAVVVEHDGLSCGLLVDCLGAVGPPGQSDPLPVLALPPLLALEPPGDPALTPPPGAPPPNHPPNRTPAQSETCGPFLVDLSV